MSKASERSPNSLIHETSPYLLQHAYNPVQWLPFSDKAFDQAKRENKPVLISIGYSACHWCHVMEHESFEDSEVAALMNKYFINIKVDREERSDVDMLYMQAVQLMTGQGGWPLNCFVLPDGRPFYGGTYFRKDQWMNILRNLADIHKNDPAKVEAYAAELLNGIRQSEMLTTAGKSDQSLDSAVLKDCVNNWKTRLDNSEGGPNRAPKFPLPNNYLFLMRYALLEQDKPLLEHVELTLTKMAFGGIYDQLRGGFSRYSTDMLWKVPHFEKMLYDNSQLVSLYCETYTHTKNELYKEIALETLNFVRDEWLSEEGAFYSAFDADSDGEEGKYYVWKKEDLEDLLAEDFPIFSRYYEINDKGYWEHGNYILMRSENVSQMLLDLNISRTELEERIARCKEILEQESRSRIKPGLDDKSITAWNAQMATAYAQAYRLFGIAEHREIALRSVNFILQKLRMPDGKLYRTYKAGEAKIQGFLDDYAFTIEALMNSYLISQNEEFLRTARELCDIALKEFKNGASDLLYYTGASAAPLAARTSEMQDNVIPSSNSQMAINLFMLGTYFEEQAWIDRSDKMLKITLEELKHYGSGYSNWGCLALMRAYPLREVVIVGNNVDEKLRELSKHGLTNTIFAVHAHASDLPLVKDRYVEGKTLIYVCQNKTCQLPVTSVNEALNQLV